MPVHLIRIESNLDRSYALLGWIEPVPHEIPYKGVAPIEVITCTGTHPQTETHVVSGWTQRCGYRHAKVRGAPRVIVPSLFSNLFLEVPREFLFPWGLLFWGLLLSGPSPCVTGKGQ